MSSSRPETFDSTRSKVRDPTTNHQSAPPWVFGPAFVPSSHLAREKKLTHPPRYDQAKLLEINAHSLFSKWFSESGKLVQGLFATLGEMIEGGSRFVVVLIGRRAFHRVRQVVVGDRSSVVSLDEVESLTAARAAALAGTEPSDGLRVSPPF